MTALKRVELFAYPAWHSLSPAMHNAAFAVLGIDARYHAREVPPPELAAAVASLRAPDVLGANVTIPHKESVVPLLDWVSPGALAVGAVNTIVRRGESLDGHNTDVEGFMRALTELRIDVDGRRVLLLGAGGAARAVAYALLMSGVGELLIHNRSEPRARRLAADFAQLGRITVLREGDLGREASGVRLLVNATSVGMLREGVSFDETPIGAHLLPGKGAVIDLIYRPAHTRLLLEARTAGLETQNGLPMLVYQGAEAFSLWTGHDAPVEAMFAAAKEVLAG